MKRTTLIWLGVSLVGTFIANAANAETLDVSVTDIERSEGTIELAHTLDLKVVAEGVETLEVYELLRKMNCDYAQGYYIAHPLAADQVAAWYEQPGKLASIKKSS